MIHKTQSITNSKTAILHSFNPATMDLLGEVPIMGSAEVDHAVEQAWVAYESWHLTTFRERRRMLSRLREVIEQRKEELAKLVSDEVGKPLAESYFGDIFGTLGACAWLIENGERELRTRQIALNNPLMVTKRSYVNFEPLGVIGIIAPWNYPFSIPMMTILMALMAGNTVVLKPSEKSPLTGLKIGELFKRSGFPENVVSIVTGERITGEYLSRSRLAKLIFTGSAAAGAQVMAQASTQLTPVCLELGGKDAAIVLPDAPIETTACGLAWGAFSNAGQACASIERLYLVKGESTSRLIERLVEITKSLQVGLPTDENTQVGPIIDEGQFSKIMGQVDEAVSMGAEILSGGKRVDGLPGYFFRPTILSKVNHTMRIMNDETFGPVLPFMIVDSEAEAIRLANQSEYGLSASVWTKDTSRAKMIAGKLNTGTVFINDNLFSHAVPQLPWGGVKKSGFGRSHSYFGLLDMVNIKHVSVDRAGAHQMWWYPYNQDKIKSVLGGIQFFHSSSPLRKAEGLQAFVSEMLRKK
jgi:acyl-CoA reductase-like NAD-dependent aldehyde dehydrogenase